MAHKCWKTWLRVWTVACLVLVAADFTTECQRPCDCRWQSGNKAAVCANASLATVPGNLSSDIQILDLSNNNLLQLHQDAFRKVGLTNLKKLFLRECSIEVVHKAAFVSLAIMIELDLSRNKIHHLHPDTFRGTEKLRMINLNNNFIDKLEDGLFRNLKYLQKVEVSNNRITRIATRTFVNLPQLKILRIDGNALTHIKPEALMALRNLSGLDLHNNPWRCDCNLQTFRDWVINHNLYTPPTSCAEPAAVRDRLWNELDSSNFACRPTILEPLPDSIVKSYDENVTLVCKVVGNPTPEVVWRYNGRTIEARSFGEIRYATNENTVDLIRWVNLTIINARYSDRGNYTCVAENPGGKDEQTLTLILTKYNGMGTLIGLDSDSFAIVVGCLTSIVIIFGVVLGVCYFTSQKSSLKRLIKTDNRSTNGEALIEASVASEAEKSYKLDVNPISKPPRKYEPATLASTETELADLNKTLLNNEAVAAKEELLQQEVELPKVPQEFIVSASHDTQAYPPDLLTFPLRSTSQVSPASATSSGKDRVVLTKIDSPNSPNYRISPATPTLYSKFQNSNFQSIPFSNSKGYVTLPRRPRSSFPESALGPQIYSTLNGVIPYYDTFNMKLFGHGGNYYSINKSEMDLGPVNKSSFLNASDDLEPAPSPAPGTPHANIPRNSLSSPNIHNQLMAQMTNGKREQKALTVRLENNYPLRNSSADLKAFFNVSSGSLGRARGHKTSKRSSVDIKEQFLNTIENATEV
ncbi:uncharacterized protein LOC121725854 isoform X2 [Aricia agestis]|uniref:uncharacterized protein LOC121725854 isoform X2 n=1 Tax=Aricia agestis TaxID=91739 RepID=UPI001C2056AC|nr:uncharacterized protein LOC121725854 isoform X2 [Aricia agestis]